jgi:gluconokinase
MILIVAGVAGSGKTTVGELIARRLRWIFADGDDFHPPANVGKMEDGIPLTDADRQPWLIAIGEWMDKCLANGTPGVVACSALKRHYRQTLLGGRAQAVMAFLAVSWDDDQARIFARKGHFFTEPLLASQFASLELPDHEDRVHVVNSDGRPAERIADEIITLLGLRPA